MKTNFNFYPNLIVKAFHRTRVLFLLTLATTTLLVSCTADEIEVQSKPKTAKEVYFQRKDSVVTVPTTNTTTNTTTTNTTTTTTSTTTSGTIDPPKFPPPPTPPTP